MHIRLLVGTLLFSMGSDPAGRMKRAISLVTMTMLLLVVSACNAFADPQAGRGTAATKSATTKAQPAPAPARACPATTKVVAAPAKPTPQQQEIFSLLDDKDLAAAKALIESDPQVVNVKDSDGMTPLALMAMVQNLTVSVNNGLSGTFKDNSATPKVPLVAELLIARGADVNPKDDHGGTPLIWAIMREKTGLANLLIKNCADVYYTLDVQGEEGMTPLHFAAGHGDLGIVTALISAGAKVNAKNAKGQTALSMASEYGWAPIVELLLQKGADVNVRDTNGSTPLKAANSEGHTAVAETLKKKGAVE